MAEIHPVVRRLIDALLESDLPALGRLAEGRVLEDAGGDEAGAAVSRKGSRDDDMARGARQLALAAGAVEDALDLELELLERNQQLLRDYRALRGDDAADVDRPRLETVIVGDALGESGTDAVFRGEHVVSGARRERIQKLLKAWGRGVKEAREEMESNGLG